MKIIVDMNMSPRWADALRSAGIEATHWSVHGLAYAEDESIMAFAVREGCCVLTRDMDFGAILAATGAIAPSVILHRNGARFVPALVEELITILGRAKAELEAGAVVSVGMDRARIRPLPLGRRMDDE